MPGHRRTLLVAIALSLIIALVSGARWPHFVMGAAFALSLWSILLLSTYGLEGPGLRSVAWSTYAMAAVVTLVLGSVFLWIGGRDNGAWWGPAVIMAGAISWPITHAAQRRETGPESG